MSLSYKIRDGNPSNCTSTALPASFDPSMVDIDPGTTGPVAKLAAFTTLATTGGWPTGAGGGCGPGTINSVIGMKAVPASGPASTVRIALYVPGIMVPGSASTRRVALSVP